MSGLSIDPVQESDTPKTNGSGEDGVLPMAAGELPGSSPSHSRSMGRAAAPVGAAYGWTVVDRAVRRTAHVRQRTRDCPLSPAEGGVSLRLPGVLPPSFSPSGGVDRASLAGG